MRAYIYSDTTLEWNWSLVASLLLVVVRVWRQELGNATQSSSLSTPLTLTNSGWAEGLARTQRAIEARGRISRDRRIFRWDEKQHAPRLCHQQTTVSSRHWVFFSSSSFFPGLGPAARHFAIIYKRSKRSVSISIISIYAAAPGVRLWPTYPLSIDENCVAFILIATFVRPFSFRATFLPLSLSLSLSTPCLSLMYTSSHLFNSI